MTALSPSRYTSFFNDRGLRTGSRQEAVPARAAGPATRLDRQAFSCFSIHSRLRTAESNGLRSSGSSSHDHVPA